MNESILSIVAHVANTRKPKNEWILWSNDSKNCEKNIFFSFKYRITDFLEFSHYILVLSCTFVSSTFHITIVVVCAAIVTFFFFHSFDLLKLYMVENRWVKLLPLVGSFNFYFWFHSAVHLVYYMRWKTIATIS